MAPIGHGVHNPAMAQRSTYTLLHFEPAYLFIGSLDAKEYGNSDGSNAHTHVQYTYTYNMKKWMTHPVVEYLYLALVNLTLEAVTNQVKHLKYLFEFVKKTSF